MAEASAPTPWLLRWQGLLPGSAAQQKRLSDLAGIVLILLMAGLPVLTRAGLGLIVLACGALWVLWSLTRTPAHIGSISGWLLLFLAVAVLATGLSPVPSAAAKGLLKLISYLGVYALMRQLLSVGPLWGHTAGVMPAGCSAEIRPARPPPSGPTTEARHSVAGASGHRPRDS